MSHVVASDYLSSRKDERVNEFGVLVNVVKDIRDNQGNFEDITAKRIVKMNSQFIAQKGAIVNDVYQNNSIWVYGLNKHRRIKSKSNRSSKHGVAICKTDIKHVMCIKFSDLEISYLKGEKFEDMFINNDVIKF